MDNNNNINSLDITKLVLSILIVAIHFAPFGFGNDSQLVGGANYLVSNCIARLVVPFFFMASGYLLYRKGLNEIIINTKRYVFKLFKLYVVWTIIYLPLIIYEIILVGDYLFHLLGFIRNFIFVGSYTHLWYLPATIIASLLVSFLLIKKIQIRYVVLIGLVLFSVGVLDDTWYGILPPVLKAPADIYNFCFETTRNGIFEGLLFVSIGGYLAIVRPKIMKPLIGLMVSFVLFVSEVFFVTKMN